MKAIHAAGLAAALATLAGLAALAPTAGAAEPAAVQESSTTQAAPASALAIGARTEALLEIQRSGQRAGTSQPLRGGQAEAARRRYLNSFSHPIPAQFPHGQSSAGPAAAK